MRTKGRKEIARIHQELFDKWLKGTRLVGEIRNIRFLSPEFALVFTNGGMIMNGKEKPSPERQSIQTLVAVKKNSNWKLIAFQNTRVRPFNNSPVRLFVWLFTEWIWKVLG